MAARNMKLDMINEFEKWADKNSDSEKVRSRINHLFGSDFLMWLCDTTAKEVNSLSPSEYVLAGVYMGADLTKFVAEKRN